MQFNKNYIKSNVEQITVAKEGITKNVAEFTLSQNILAKMIATKI
jgi:hypothetical protein